MIIKKSFFICIIFVFSLPLAAQNTTLQMAANTIDAWHKAAFEADFDTYFSLMTPRGVFVGTDASEHWENFRKTLNLIKNQRPDQELLP